MNEHLKDARKPSDPLNMGRKQRRWRGAVSVLTIGASMLALSYLDKQVREGEQRREIVVNRTQTFENKRKPVSFKPIILSVTIFLSSGASWTVPLDCVLARIDCIAGGANGVAGAGAAGAGGTGGGGGAWSRKNAIVTTPGGSISIQVGGVATDTWFSSSGTVLAKAGAGTAGGAAASGIGDVKNSGGGGGSGGPADSKPDGGGGGAGGGAGGPNGSGVAGSNGLIGNNAGTGGNGGSGGRGDSASGGVGGSLGAGSTGAGSNGGGGSIGTEYDASHGSGGGGGGGGGAGTVGTGGNGGAGALYGAGGGGGGGGQSTGGSLGAGVQGLIVIVYTPFTSPQFSKWDEQSFVLEIVSY